MEDGAKQLRSAPGAGVSLLAPADYRVATAEFLYHMPDLSAILQTLVWQHVDIDPNFLVLRRFLEFWERNLVGRLHSIRICRVSLVEAADLAWARCERCLH